MGLIFSCVPRIHELEVRATLTKMQFTDKAEELQVIHVAKWDIFSIQALLDSELVGGNASHDPQRII